VNPGFNPEHLLIFNVGLPSTAEPTRQIAFYEQMIERLRAAPGVQAAGAVSRLPLAGGNSTRRFNVSETSQSYSADIRVCTPDYFKTMGIPLLKGRTFSTHDSSSSLPVAIINQATAANAFAGQDPIGKFVTNFGPNHLKLQVIGVVGNVRHIGLETAARPEIYTPVAQSSWPSMFIAVRSVVTNPLTLIPSAQSAVWSIDRNLPLANPRTMQDVLGHSVLRRKFAMLLLSIFAGLATLLAAIGLYGMISFSVAQRTQEIGIRLALGAQRSDVLRLIVLQGMRFVGAGLVLGFIGVLFCSRLLQSFLFGIGATDLRTMLVVGAILAAVAFVACLIPARRATLVDPIHALRAE
jgi:putative ABC transport system permease protein